MKISKKRAGISNVLAAVIVIVVIIVAAAGGYLAKPSSSGGAASTVTQTITQSGSATGGGQTVTVTQSGSTSSAGIQTYNVGALSPLTGAISFLGPEMQTSVGIAVTDYNNYLTSIGSNVRFHLISLDTASSPQGALTATQTLVQTDGVKVLIGPHESSELQSIISFMNTNKIVSISLSSADSLAGQSPYEFRPIVIGHQASPAIAALIEHFNIKTLIVVHTNDAFGNGEAQEVEALVKNATTGAHIDDIPYALGQSDYGSVVAQLSQTLSTDGVSPTTGIFIAMDQSDGQSILTHALSYPNLAQVQWFGDQEGSSTAFLPPNVPLQVAQFRAKTNTTGIYPVDLSSPITTQFYSEYAAASGGKAIVGYGPNWYDATLIGLQASYLCITGNNYTGDCLANTVRYVSNHYIGATGPKFLDKNGDQLFTYVANWQVVNTNTGNVTIKFVTVYNPQSNSIVPYQGFYAPGY